MRDLDASRLIVCFHKFFGYSSFAILYRQLIGQCFGDYYEVGSELGPCPTLLVTSADFEMSCIVTTTL